MRMMKITAKMMPEMMPILSSSKPLPCNTIVSKKVECYFGKLMKSTLFRSGGQLLLYLMIYDQFCHFQLQ